MPKTVRIPSYRFHKGSGQGVVVLDGQSIYLGKWNTPESRTEYERIIAEWLSDRQRRHASRNGRPPQRNLLGPAGASSLSAAELILGFWQFAEEHHRHPDGTPTRELDNLQLALRPLRKLYGPTPVGEFGPLALRAI